MTKHLAQAALRSIDKACKIVANAADQVDDPAENGRAKAVAAKMKRSARSPATSATTWARPAWKDSVMSHTKEAVQRKRRSKAVPVLGAAGLSLSLASGACAVTGGLESGDRSSRVGAGKPASDGRRRHLQRQLGDIPRVRWGKYRHTAAERGAGYGSRRLWNRLVLPSEHTSACRASLSAAATVPASADPPYAQIQTLAPVNFHQTEARWREARNLSPCRMTAPAKTTRIERFRQRDPSAFLGQPHARMK